jgi:hypothetical protein
MKVMSALVLLMVLLCVFGLVVFIGHLFNQD